MNIIYLFAFFSFGVMDQAQSPFNGVFCGQGEVVIQGQVHKGNKVVELAVTDTELHLKRDPDD